MPKGNKKHNEDDDDDDNVSDRWLLEIMIHDQESSRSMMLRQV